MNPKFIYVFDSLCSWCYAFDPELQKVLDRYVSYDIQLLSGGMFSGDRRVRCSQVAPLAMAPEVYKQVAQRGNIEISDKYVQGLVMKDDYYLDSDRTSTGLIAFKSFKSDGRTQLDFIFQTQQQMYVDGVNPNSDEYYTNVLPNFDIKADKFLPKLQDQSFQDEAKEEMNEALQLGVNSYPQLFLQTAKDKYYHVAQGYTTADVVNERVDKIVAEMANEQ